MSIKKIVLFILIITPFFGNAQQKKGIEYSGFFDSYYWRGPLSVTGGIGLAMYNGDLCSSLACSKPSPYYTLGLGYKLWPRVFVGAEVDYFTLNGTDEKTIRGFEFTSKNIEIAAYMNFYLLEDIIRKHHDLKKKSILLKPYLYLGVSGLRYNVSDNVGEAIFPRYTALIPVGLGVLVDITPRVGVKVDAVYKIGFSDLLDGASQTANPERNDGFGMARIKLVYTPKARRAKPKKSKINQKEIEKLNNNSNNTDSTKANEITTPEEVEKDPDEDYYNEEEEPIQDAYEDGQNGGDYYYDEEESNEDESNDERDNSDETDQEEPEEESWDGDW